MKSEASLPSSSLSRRTWLGGALVAAAAAMVPTSAEARCARPSVAAEARRSRYVFEGTVVSISGMNLTFQVTAVWRGTPPDHVTVARSERSSMAPTASDVGQSYLVFAHGESDTSLAMSRCGSSGPLASATETLAELRRAHLTRTAR